jgi:N-methylhydantoinase A
VARIRLALDTGGTFTDIVALDEDSGAIHATKTPSTPADPSVGFMDGVHKIARQAGFALHDVSAVAHGTTVATNALLSEEGSLPGLGLIVTRGFKHILEIARQSVPQGYGNSYFWVKPERIVPLHHVCEVSERVDFRGEALAPLSDVDVHDAATFLRASGVDCIGVCLLHAYANGAHERRVRDILKDVYPRASVSISSEVLPEYREYERAVTTLIDAFVKPKVGRYVAQIDTRLQAEAGRAGGLPFYIMKSNGGVVSAREVAAQPISTLLSGPAAGALGAALLASAAGVDRVLTLDGGGTSTDVTVLVAGAPHLSTESRVGPHLVKIPMIDVVTVGAGGGSIARRAPDGRLKVGPTSAGADPGPMCYGRGGRSPTVTDAMLVLGRLPAHLLGGEIPLDAQLAERGVRELADSLGMDTRRTALGILEIAAWNQANAVRQVTVKRGLDVRDYVLVAFGGSGPLQAARLIDLLGLRAALVPLDPGNVSAFGLLTVDVKNDYVLTQVQRDDALDLERLNTAYARLEAQAREALHAEGFSPEATRLVRSADLRYFGQAWEVSVEAPGGCLDRDAANVTVARFHVAHQQAYGYSYVDQPAQRVEWVNLRVSALGPLPRPAVQPRPRPFSGGVERALTGKRQVIFDADADLGSATPVYSRERFQPGDCLEGPAIVEEFGSTTVIFPGQSARVDEYANLVLERSA